MKTKRQCSEILNEKGIALVMVLILSAIALAISAAMIFFVLYGTQVSGLQKRYKTALEAGMGGTDLIIQYIGLRAETSLTSALDTDLATLNPAHTTNTGCSGTYQGTVYTGFAAKLNSQTSTWNSSCNSSMTIDPGTATSYDMRFDVGSNPTYRVYGKIVNTVEGNTGADLGLIKDQVVGSNEEGGITMSYIYTIEVDAENLNNPNERAKLSILYQH